MSRRKEKKSSELVEYYWLDFRYRLESAALFSLLHKLTPMSTPYHILGLGALQEEVGRWLWHVPIGPNTYDFDVTL